MNQDANQMNGDTSLMKGDTRARMAFEQRLQKAMDMHNLRQNTLSKMTGISKASISQYLAGLNVPNWGNLRKLADALEVPENYLAGYTAEQDVPDKDEDGGDDWNDGDAGSDDGSYPHSVPTGIKQERILPRHAARCMGTGEGFVRMGLRENRFSPPIGAAVQSEGSSQWQYYISPGLLRAYIGDELYDQYFFRSGKRRKPSAGV
jgi:transcriptional regulator with XRE-family HTH domain